MAGAEKTLTAVLQAKESITEALENVEESLEETATAARNAAEGIEQNTEETEELGKQAAQTASDLQGEIESLKEVKIDSEKAAMAKESVADANEELGRAAKTTASSLDDENRALTEMAVASESTEELIDKLARAELIARDRTEELKDEFQDLAVSEITASMATAEITAKLMPLSRELDEVEDQAEEAATGLDRFGMSALSTSLNIGPFNFALRNLLTQMPLLIMTAGTLTTVLFGLASAATAVALGLGAIFGGGMLAMAQGFAQSSEDIKNTMQGLQKVMKRASKMFLKALRPLMNTQTLQMFTNLMEGLAVAVNFVAQSIASLQGYFQQFAGTIGATFFQHFDEVMRQVEKTIIAFMPILADFFAWFMDALPEAIAFFREKTLEFLPTLKNFAGAMLEFFRAFTELGIAAMEGLLPVLAGTLQFLTMFADLLNSLPDGLIAFVAAAVVGSKVLAKVVGVGSTLVKVMGDLYKAIFLTDGALNTLKSTMSAIGGPFNVWADLIEELQVYLIALNEHLAESDNLLSRFRGSTRGMAFSTGFSLPFDTWEDNIVEFGDRWDHQMTRIRERFFGTFDLFSEMEHPAPTGDILPSGTLLRSEGPGLMGDNQRWDPDSGVFEPPTVKGWEAAKFRVMGALVDMRNAVSDYRKAMSDFLTSVPGRFKKAFGEATTAAAEFATDGLGRATTYLRETGDEMAMLADDVLNVSGKMSMLQRQWQELGQVVTQHRLMPDTGAVENVGLFEGLGRNERERIDMSEYVHPSQWTPEDEFTWNPTGGLGMDKLRAKSFGFGDTSLGRKASGLKKRTRMLAAEVVTLAGDFELLKGTVSDTAERYVRLAGVKYQNIRATISEILASKRLSNAYMDLSDNALTSTLRGYWDLITTKATNYWWSIRQTAANYGLAGSFGAVYGAVATAIGSLYSFITSEVLATGTSLSFGLSLDYLEDMLGKVKMGAISAAASILGTLIPSFLIAEAGVLSLGTLMNVMLGGIPMLLGAIAVAAGAVAGGLGMMGKSGKETSGIMQFLHGIMSGLMDLLITVGVPTWNMLVQAAEATLAPFLALNQILTAIGQALGIIGKDGSFITSLLSLIADILGKVAELIGWAINKLMEAVDHIPGVDVSGSLSSLEVSKQDVRKGSKKAGKHAGRMFGRGVGPGAQAAQSGKQDKQNAEKTVTKKQTKTVHKTQETNYNFGDFNMKPENKAEVKRLVKDALAEANRNRRIRNGGV